MNITKDIIRRSIEYVVDRDLHEFYRECVRYVIDEFYHIYPEELPTQKDVRHRLIKQTIKKAGFYECFVLDCYIKADMNITKANTIMKDKLVELVNKLDKTVQEERKV